MLIAQRIIQKCSFLSNIQRGLLLLVIQAIYCCRSRVNFASMGRLGLVNEKTIGLRSERCGGDRCHAPYCSSSFDSPDLSSGNTKSAKAADGAAGGA